MKHHDHFIYPAIFFKDGDYVCVRFPDLPVCNTFGDDLDDAMTMARDALGGHLLAMDEDGDDIPAATPFDEVGAASGETVVLIEVWLSVLRDEDRNRAVKKTITIPNWLNQKAMAASINFSSVMQEALRQRLGV